MKSENRVDLLKGIIVQMRDFKEQKKAINEEKKAAEEGMYEEILNEEAGDNLLHNLKTEYSIIVSKIKERKEINAKIKRLDGAMEKIIMGEDEYDDCQMTIDDIMDGKGQGVVIEDDDEEEE